MNVRTRFPLPVRCYRLLVRVLLRRRFAPDYVDQTVITFSDLYRAAGAPRSGGPGRLIRRSGLIVREYRALLATAFAEWRTARRADRVVVEQQVLTAGSDPGWGRERSSRSGEGWTADLAADIRHAWRNLRTRPAFTATALGLLVLGTTGTIMAFGAFNTVFIRPVPWLPDPDRVICLFRVEQGGRYLPFSWGDFLDLRAGLGEVAELAAASLIFPLTDTPSGTADEIVAEQVSPGYFRILGVPLALGRGFIESDLAAGGEVAVISHRLWQQAYGGAPDVLDRAIRLDGREHAIVGVASPGLTCLGSNLMRPEAWVPILPLWQQSRDYQSLRIVGRLGPDAGLAGVQVRARTLAAGLVEKYPQYWTDHREQARTIEVLTERGARLPPPVRLQVITESLVVFFFILLILIVACANIGNLQLARGWERAREIAVRLALGAGRRRLLRMLLIESLVLSLLAVAAALGLICGLTWLADRFPGFLNLPVELRVALDLRVVLFSIGVALLTTIVFGLIPARQIVRPDLIAFLKGNTTGGPTTGSRLRRRFVVAQVAGSLVLVSLGTLSVRNYQKLRMIDPGLETGQVDLLTLDLGHAGYGETDGRDFTAELQARLENLPGVERVAVARLPVMGGSRRIVSDVVPIGFELPPGESFNCSVSPVGPGYFDLLGIPLLTGRDFGPGDSPAGEPVAIVNQSYARRLFPGSDAVGRTIRVGEAARIVAVVRDARSFSLSDPPIPQVWVPLAQNFATAMTFHIRTASDPRGIVTAVRELVREMDDRLPVPEIGLLEELAARDTTQARSALVIVSAAGLVILILAMTGLYGMMIFTVGQRRREFGIRISLGAGSRDMIGMILADGIGLSLKGSAVGLLLVFLVTPFSDSLFAGVSAFDPPAFAAALVLLLVTALAATLPPALRATRTDPVEALRQE